MAAVFKATGNADSALWYSKIVLAEKTTKSFPTALLKAADLLTTIYELKNKPDSALKYLRIATEIKDNLFNREKAIAIQNLTYKEQEKQKAIAAAELKFQNETKNLLFPHDNRFTRFNWCYFMEEPKEQTISRNA